MLHAFLVGNVVAFGNGDYSQLSVPQQQVQGAATAIGAGFRTSYILGPDLRLPPVAAPPPPGAAAHLLLLTCRSVLSHADSAGG
jgi:hypothetical protein